MVVRVENVALGTWMVMTASEQLFRNDPWYQVTNADVMSSWQPSFVRSVNSFTSNVLSTTTSPLHLGTFRAHLEANIVRLRRISSPESVAWYSPWMAGITWHYVFKFIITGHSGSFVGREIDWNDMSHRWCGRWQIFLTHSPYGPKISCKSGSNGGFTEAVISHNSS